jgi:tetratricopeptide (TPR) repeat protein
MGDSVRTTFLSRAALVSLVLSLAAAGCGPPAAGDPAEQIQIGWNRYRVGEFGDAIAAFEKARDATPAGRPLHVKALYGLATSWNLRRPGEDPELARRLYQQVLDLAPASDEAAWSLLALARMKHLLPVGQEPDLAEVRRAYQEVIDRFPNHVAGHEAFMHQQATLVASFKPEDARQVITNVQAFIQKHPDSQFLSPLYGLIGTCHFILNEPEERLAAELKAYDTHELDPTNPNQDNTGVYWSLACMAEYDVGDFATARRFYRLLLEEYPADIRVYAAKQSLKRMDEIEARFRAELAAPKPSAAGGGR